MKKYLKEIESKLKATDSPYEKHFARGQKNAINKIISLLKKEQKEILNIITNRAVDILGRDLTEDETLDILDIDNNGEMFMEYDIGELIDHNFDLGKYYNINHFIYILVL